MRLVLFLLASIRSISTTARKVSSVWFKPGLGVKALGV